MGANATIISLACQIAKLKQWGKAWQQTANAKQAEVDELRTEHARQLAGLRESFRAQTEADAKLIAAAMAESLRLKAELAVAKDDRDRLLRSATTAVGALFSDSQQRERAVMAMLPAVTERMRDGGSMVVLPDNRHIASALSLGLRQLAESDMATHDTPAGKAAAQTLYPPCPACAKVDGGAA